MAFNEFLLDLPFLVLLKRKIEKENADDYYLTYGFNSRQVFGLSQTDGKPLEALFPI